MPFGKDSIKNQNLGYLTTEQAIADYAELINYLQNNTNVPKHPVIAFGGTYRVTNIFFQFLRLPTSLLVNICLEYSSLNAVGL